MSDKKAWFISMIIMLLFTASVVFSSLLFPGIQIYILYVLSFFGILWLFVACFWFIKRDEGKRGKK